ncbi:uncharacterized protein [Ptychodera flava]|uniref:uncharacterized protein n=1 Tax=Ptychodera flava TaxID=63121 RepID=UPI00396A9A0E
MDTDIPSLASRTAQSVNVNNNKERLHLKGLERSLENALDVKKHIYRQEEREMLRHLQKLQRDKEIRYSSYALKTGSFEDVNKASNKERKESNTAMHSSWEHSKSSHGDLHDCRYNTSCQAHHMLPPVDGSRDFHVKHHHHHHPGHHHHHQGHAHHHGHGHGHGQQHQRHHHFEHHLHPDAHVRHPTEHHSLHRLHLTRKHSPSRIVTDSDRARHFHTGHSPAKDSHFPDLHQDAHHGRRLQHVPGPADHDHPHVHHGQRRTDFDERLHRPHEDSVHPHLRDGRFHMIAWQKDSKGPTEFKPQPPSSQKPEGKPTGRTARVARKQETASKDSSPEYDEQQRSRPQDKTTSAKRYLSTDQPDGQILSRSQGKKSESPGLLSKRERSKETGSSKGGRTSPIDEGKQGTVQKTEKSKHDKSKSYHGVVAEKHIDDVTKAAPAGKSQPGTGKTETPEGQKTGPHLGHDVNQRHHHGDRHTGKATDTHLDHQEQQHQVHGSSEGDSTTPALNALKSINPSFYRYLADKHHISLNPELLAQLHSLMKSSTDVLHGSHPERILPQVFGPVCSTGRSHRKKMLALEFLTKMLPEIIKHAEEHPDFNPADTLQCRYLRLTGSNVAALEEMCRKGGVDVEIHPHSNIEDIARFIFDKADQADAEGHNLMSTRQQ